MSNAFEFDWAVDFKSKAPKEVKRPLSVDPCPEPKGLKPNPDIVRMFKERDMHKDPLAGYPLIRVIV